MADEDPDKMVINAELEGFIVLLHNAIDKVTAKGSSFSSFRRLLDRRVASIRAEGFSDLADSIVEDLDRLEQDLERFLKLRSEGAHSYISARIESIIKAKEAKRNAAEDELRQLQTQSERIRASLSLNERTRADLLQSIELQNEEVARLRKALEDAEETCSLLNMDLGGIDKTCTKLSQQLKSCDEKSAELELKIIKTLTLDDSSRTLLERELEREYTEELLSLAQQIRQHRLA